MKKTPIIVRWICMYTHTCSGAHTYICTCIYTHMCINKHRSIHFKNEKVFTKAKNMCTRGSLNEHNNSVMHNKEASAISCTPI